MPWARERPELGAIWVYLAGPMLGAALAVVGAYMLRGRGGGLAGSQAAQGALFTQPKNPEKA